MPTRVTGRSQFVLDIEVHDLFTAHRALSPGRGFYGWVGRSGGLLALGLSYGGLVGNGTAQLLEVRYELVPTLIIGQGSVSQEVITEIRIVPVDPRRLHKLVYAFPSSRRVNLLGGLLRRRTEPFLSQLLNLLQERTDESLIVLI
jgi:hypothetical protein